ncbi:MAG: TIGR02301 family protein [Aquisalinus sp.]|nr:TIGR02301 family protein [Aquisalinus sp.]
MQPSGGPEVETQLFSFAERQQQLIDMAQLLGQIHHLHQICQPYDYFPERYRDRMKELVTLEEPITKTKDAMITSFNDGFQYMKAEFDYCNSDAETQMRELGSQGVTLTGKLAMPFRRGVLTDPSKE